MTTKRIRKLTVEEVSNTQSETTKYIAQVYSIGGKRNIPSKDRKPIEMTISIIDEQQDSFAIYLENDSISKIWKSIPKTHKYQIEYFLDEVI